MIIDDLLIGDTVKLTWVSSGVSPTTIHAAVFTGSETLIGSQSMISSTNGHFYTNYTLPDTAAFYAVEFIAIIETLPYKRRLKLRTVTEEVN